MPATINRELAFLRRVFNAALSQPRGGDRAGAGAAPPGRLAQAGRGAPHRPPPGRAVRALKVVGRVRWWGWLAPLRLFSCFFGAAAERRKLRCTQWLFALRSDQPSPRRVYQPAALP